MQSEALKDVLLPVKRAVVGVFGDDELDGEGKGGHSADKRAEWRGGNERWFVSIVSTAKFGANVTSLEQTGRFVVEQFSDFLTDEFKAVFLLLVAFGQDGFFDDFELIPAFEAAVVFSLGLLGLCRFWIFVPLRWFVVVSRGGPGLSRVESLQQELELGGVDLFVFRSVVELDEGVDLLPEQPVLLTKFFDDTVFVVGWFDVLVRADCGPDLPNSRIFRTKGAWSRREDRRRRKGD